MISTPKYKYLPVLSPPLPSPPLPPESIVLINIYMNYKVRNVLQIHQHQKEVLHFLSQLHVVLN